MKNIALMVALLCLVGCGKASPDTNQAENTEAPPSATAVQEDAFLGNHKSAAVATQNATAAHLDRNASQIADIEQEATRLANGQTNPSPPVE